VRVITVERVPRGSIGRVIKFLYIGTDEWAMTIYGLKI